MRELSHLVLYAWAPFTILCFAMQPPRRALVFCMLAGMMFLPQDSIPITGLPDISKPTVIVLGCFLGALIFDSARVFGCRPALRDLPAVVLTLMPAASSILNGYSAYSAFSEMLEGWLMMGGAYWLGRIYFSDEEGKRDLMLGLVAAGVLYAPLCLYEIRMSPQLHLQLYGIFPSAFDQTMRWGGFRPVVFFGHGLSLSFFMAMSTITLAYLYSTGGVKSVVSVPAGLVMAFMLGMLILCKSSGAMLLTFLSLVAIHEAKAFKSRRILWGVIGFAACYVPLRIFRIWEGDTLVEMAGWLSAERQQSLAYRVNNEKLLLAALESNFWVGRGPSPSVNAVYDAELGSRWIVADSVWINLFTGGGALTTLSFWAMIVLSAVRGLRAVDPREWLAKRHACTVAMTVITAVFVLDCVANATVFPLTMACVGGLTGIVYERKND